MRYAIIGTGNMGRKYATMLNDGKVSGAQLTAVVCRSDEAVKWAGDSLSESILVCRNADELFENADKFDALLIVTPHKTHPELAKRAFDMGKAVFCDKPAGVSVKDAKDMCRWSEESGQIYAMMFHQRLYPKYKRIKGLIDSGELGRITRVMLVNSRYYRTQHYHKSGSWRSSWEGEGGGALINQGQHILDIWQWLFGMPKKVYAQIPFGKYNDFKVDDEATVMMEYPNNMSAVFMLTTGEAVWEERLEIVGTKASILMEDDDITITRYSMDSEDYGKTAMTNSREGLELTTEHEHFEHAEEPYVQMLENFAQVYQADSGQHASLVAPGIAGFNTLQITNAAYLSAWKGTSVTMPIDTDEYEEFLEKCKDQ